MMSLALALLLVSVAADEVELTDGTIIQGKVRDLGDSIRVEKPLGSVTYPKFMVRRIEYRKTPGETYREKRDALEKDDLEGRLALARWCISNKLVEEALAEYRNVLEREPDHEEARAALGFQRHLGKWKTEEEINRARGWVRHGGTWMTPEERDLEVALENQKDLDRRLSIEVRKLMTATHSKNPAEREEARRRLSSMERRFTERSYMRALKSKYPETRRFSMEELGRFGVRDAARLLARMAIWEPRTELRPVALRALVAIDHPDTVTFLVPFLRERSGRARIRAAGALSRFKDLRGATPMVNQLKGVMETIRTARQYSRQATAIVNRVMILRDGTRILLPKRVQIETQSFDKAQMDRLVDEKHTLISALRSVTGQDFGDSTSAWHTWLRKQK